jgi:hypothetical protein
MSLLDSFNVVTPALNSGAGGLINQYTPADAPADAPLTELPGVAGDVMDVRGGEFLDITERSEIPLAAQRDSVPLSASVQLAAGQSEIREEQALYNANAQVIAAQDSVRGNLIDMTDSMTQSQPPDEDSDSVL